MFEARRVVALLMLAGSAASAQSTAAYRAQLDSLVRVWRPLEAEEIASRTQPRPASAFPPDSFRVGVVTVRADSQLESIARAAAGQLTARTERKLGGFAQRVGKYQFLLRAKAAGQDTASMVTTIADSMGRSQSGNSIFKNASALEAAWEQQVAEIVRDLLDQAAQSWLRTPIPLGDLTSDDWTQTRIELLLSGSAAAQDCVRGDIAQCRRALGLTPTADPLFDLYSADQRASIVSINGRALKRADAEQFDRCIRRKALTACDSLARLIPPEAVPSPVPPSVHQSLLRFAIETGGPGAFDRFVSDTLLASRLSAASRLPVDSLVSRWRERAVDSRRAQTTLDPLTAISSLFWVAVCGGLAMRSSRWR